VVCVLVMDACPYWMWEHHLGRQPNFARLRAGAREYDRALLDYMSSSTTVSHAVLATGQPPARTGIPINHTPLGPGRYAEVFRGDDPARLLVPTVADLYDAARGSQVPRSTRKWLARSSSVRSHVAWGSQRESEGTRRVGMASPTRQMPGRIPLGTRPLRLSRQLGDRSRCQPEEPQPRVLALGWAERVVGWTGR
jgi:hypothetical protein